MSQSAATKLVSKLRFKLHDRRNLRNPDGPQGRHNKIKKTLTALLKYERIELNYHRADESRGYAERLISDAIRYGDCHQPTMEMASYWIIEPQIVHKLFKVLAPRYKFSETAYTKLWRAPNIYPGHGRPKCVLELRNNVFPPLEPDKSHHKNQIHNVLLEEARKEYFREKNKQNAQLNESSKKEASQPVINENIQTESIAEGGLSSESASELPKDENLKNISVSMSDNVVQTETNSPLESDIDLSKLKIEEEKQKTTGEPEK